MTSFLGHNPAGQFENEHGVQPQFIFFFQAWNDLKIMENYPNFNIFWLIYIFLLKRNFASYFN